MARDTILSNKWPYILHRNYLLVRRYYRQACAPVSTDNICLCGLYISYNLHNDKLNSELAEPCEATKWDITPPIALLMMPKVLETIVSAVSPPDAL